MSENQLEVLLKAQEAMQLMAEEIDRLNVVVSDQSQELETWHRVTQSTDEFDMSETAKILNYRGYGRNKIFEILRDEQILRVNNQPYQRFVDCGYFRICETTKTDSYGNERIFIKTLVTQKGLDYIRKLLDGGSLCTA